MGVYIAAMEMPKVCAKCPFWETRYDSGYYQYEHCKALGKIFNECRFDIDPFREKLDDCPLIEIDDTEWEWCHDCKEYDQEAHCCHRWTKVIRKTVEDVKESYKIVTCGECKHSKEWYGDHRLCYLWAETGIGVFEDGYCSYGERRADDKTEESRP